MTYMKTLILMVGVGLITSPYRVEAEPFDESKGSRFYHLSKPLDKKVTIPAPMLVDDYIVALSQISSTNIIADATHISTEDWTQPFPSSPTALARGWKAPADGASIVSLLRDFEETQQFSELRYNDTTYLLWNKPDALQTARLIVAANRHRPTEALPNEVDLYRALDEYAKGPLKWQKYDEGLINPPFHTLKFGEVPPELRAQVKALAQHEILRPDLRQELLLTDNYWKTARLALSSTLTQKGNRAGLGPQRKFFRLHLLGQDENGETLPIVAPFEQRFQFSSGRAAKSVYDRPDVDREAIFIVIAPTPLRLTPQLAPPEVAVLPAPGLGGAQLEAEIPLQTKISVEAKRRPLGDLLAEVAKKGDIKLIVGEGVPAKTTLVTTRVNEMPLGNFMGALGRLYDVYWTKRSPNQYTLHAGEKNLLQTSLMQLGAGGSFSPYVNWYLTYAQEQEYGELEQQIVAELLEQGNEKSEGVSLSVLPEDLQLRLRQAVEEIFANRIISKYQQVSKFITDQSVMRLSHTLFYGGSRASRLEWEVKLLMPIPKDKEEYAEALFATTVFAPPVPSLPQDEVQPAPVQ